MWSSLETEGAGPQTSKWINSKGKVVLDTCFGKEDLCILALIQETHCKQMSLEEEMVIEGTSFNLRKNVKSWKVFGAKAKPE